MMVSVDLSVSWAIWRKLFLAFFVRWSTICLSSSLILLPPVGVLVRSSGGRVGIGLPRCWFLLRGSLCGFGCVL